MNTTQTLTSGYRGSKVHAVIATKATEASGEGMSLCRWLVKVGDVEFSDMGIVTCRTCAKAARRS